MRIGTQKKFFFCIFMTFFACFRDDSHLRELFTSRLNEDRTESSYSYVEFLRHVRQEVRR